MSLQCKLTRRPVKMLKCFLKPCHIIVCHCYVVSELAYSVFIAGFSMLIINMGTKSFIKVQLANQKQLVQQEDANHLSFLFLLIFY